MPDLDERSIAEQTHIASTATPCMFRVGGCICDIDLYFDSARRNSGIRRGAAGERQFHNRLTPIFLRNVLRHVRTLAGENIGEQSGIIKLIEEPFDWCDVESVMVIPPKNLIPRRGRAVE